MNGSKCRDFCFVDVWATAINRSILETLGTGLNKYYRKDQIIVLENKEILSIEMQEGFYSDTESFE